jgi:CheY-like chemotaxis protein
MKTILVVDDNEDIRASVGIVLTAAGYLVAYAVDGAEALAHIRKESPACMLLDLLMPGIDGWEVRRQQLLDPILALIPTIILSGSAHTREYMPDTKIMSKPVNAVDLLDAIQVAVA